MRLILPNVDGRANALGFRPPVSTGLVGWWWLGGSKSASEKNHAYTSQAALMGSPTIHESYVSFGGFAANQWLQTEIAETEDLTWMCVARTGGTLASAAERPALLTTWAGSDPGYANQTNGSLLYYPSTTGGTQGTLTGGVGHHTGGTVTMDLGATLSVADRGAWAFLGMSFNDTSNEKVLFNKTLGTSATNTVSTSRSPRTELKLRIGGGHNSTAGGPCDMAWAAAYSSGLTAEQIQDTYEFVQNTLDSLYGLSV